MGIGSTDLSRRTCSLSLPGKCRVFRRKWFTFPRGRLGYRLHRPLWRHSQFPPLGKVPGIPAKTVHFPPRSAGVSAPQTSLAALAVSPSRESAGFFRENGSLSPADCRGTGFTGISGDTRHSLPGESAGNSCENGSLSPVADRGTGPTGLSGGTWHFHPQGKCREFLRKWFTFPEVGWGIGSTDLSRRTCSLSLPGKCRAFPRKRFTFPPVMRLLRRSSRACLGKCLVYRHSGKGTLLDLGSNGGFVAKKRAVQQIFRTYILNNQYNAFEL